MGLMQHQDLRENKDREIMLKQADGPSCTVLKTDSHCWWQLLCELLGHSGKVS